MCNLVVDWVIIGDVNLICLFLVKSFSCQSQSSDG